MSGGLCAAHAKPAGCREEPVFLGVGPSLRPLEHQGQPVHRPGQGNWLLHLAPGQVARHLSDLVLGDVGCLETVASTRALIQESPAPINDFTSLLQAYRDRDPQVLTLIERAALALGKTVTHLVSILNIRQLRIAGNLAYFGEDLLGPIRQSVDKGVLSALGAGTQVEIATLGDDIVILGAASLVLKNELGLF